MQAPNLTVNEVGFKNDYTITQWSGQRHVIDSTDGTEPTWKSSGNPDYPAAYQAGAKPTIFARFGITQSPPNPVPATLRVKLGSTVIATKDISVSGSSIAVNDIAVAQTLESKIKLTTLTFTWEISFNGSTWEGIGDSGGHKIYWIYGQPIAPAFRNLEGANYDALYDLALEKACAYANDKQTNDKSAIIRALNVGVDNAVEYDATVSLFKDRHPLDIFQAPTCQCSEHANLLRGLMRSIGIDGTTKYIWVGNTQTGQLYTYVFKDITKQPSFRITRGSHDTVAANPHFTFHAIVLAENRWWDPSYGSDDNPGITFDEASNYPSTTPPFISGNATQLIRDSYAPPEVKTLQICPHTQ